MSNNKTDPEEYLVFGAIVILIYVLCHQFGYADAPVCPEDPTAIEEGFYPDGYRRHHRFTKITLDAAGLDAQVTVAPTKVLLKEGDKDHYVLVYHPDTYEFIVARKCHKRTCVPVCVAERLSSHFTADMSRMK